MEELDIDATADVRKNYDALSYAWGERTGSRPLLCGDETILITPNCESALRHLRDPYETQSLWVDAICIDQNNSSERTAQVRMMHDIYAQAFLVVVWLGESDPDIDHALSLCMEVSEPERLQDHALDEVLVLGVRKLMDFPWWERTWVLQEFSVATRDPHFICGYTILSCRTLFPALSYLLGCLIVTRKESRPVHLIYDSEKKSALLELELLRHRTRLVQYGYVQLYGFLGPVRRRKAADPRDQIFAILGLLPKEHPMQCILNYSLPVEEIYAQATLRILEDEPNLDHLILSAPKGISQLPSWCIDFSYDKVVLFQYPNEKFSATGRATASQLFYNPECRTLKLSGTVVGTIKALQPFPETTDAADLSGNERLKVFLACYQSFLNKALETMSVSALGHEQSMVLLAQGVFWKAADVSKIMWESLVKDIPELVPDPGWWMLESFLRPLIRPEWASLLPELPKDDVLKSCLYKYAMRALVSTHECTMIATDHGELGRVDGYKAAEGDIVCILFGCRKPAILRKQGDVYELISFAWMHDFMHGEAITDDMIVEEFVLR